MDQSLNSPTTDRNGLEVLSPEECWSLLRNTPIGRIVFMHEGDAVVLPVNYALVDHHLVFRSSRGAKFGAATMQRAVSFEVDHFDAATRSGWSVLVKGRASVVLDPAEESLLDELDLQLWAGLAEDPMWMRIQPSDITGRRINPSS